MIIPEVDVAPFVHSDHCLLVVNKANVDNGEAVAAEDLAVAAVSAELQLVRYSRQLRVESNEPELRYLNELCNMHML